MRVLNSGETFYRIYAHNPDLRALKDIRDRTFGCPTQAVDVTMTGSVDLVERLQRAAPADGGVMPATGPRGYTFVRPDERGPTTCASAVKAK